MPTSATGTASLEMSARGDDLVLVTGASGFVASHVIDLLLTRGYNVRGTVRSIARCGAEVISMFPTHHGRLALVEADLLQPESWAPAMAGCKYVMHVASPAPNRAPANAAAARELIETAVQGALFSAGLCV